MSPSAIIVGGGIGGVTTAIALRCVGIDARIFERAPTVEHIQQGGGMHVHANAVKVLRELDPQVAERIRERGGVESTMGFFGWRRGTIANWPIGEWSEHAGAFTAGIRRGELHRVLSTGVSEDTFELGCECAGFEQDENGVTVRFTNGGEERADLLVAADGLRSAVRARLHGDTKPRHPGYTTHQAFTKFEHELVPYGIVRHYLGRGQRFIFFHVDPETICFICVIKVDENDTRKRSKDELLDLYRGWRAPTREMIEATPEEAIQRIDMYDRDPIERWGEGRVTLLGDAAHAMTFNLGQGANQAIEDAGVLARGLAADGRDVPAALRAYEAQRQPRTAGVQTLARRLGIIFNFENPVAVAARTAVFKVALNTVVPRKHHELMNWELGPLPQRAASERRV